MEVKLVVDGRTLTYRQGVECITYDMRNTIAHSPFSVKSDEQKPHFLLPDGSALIFNGVSACQWEEMEPVAGIAYHLVPIYVRDHLKHLVRGRELEDFEHAIRGSARLIHTIAERGRTETLELSGIFKEAYRGIKLHSITVQVGEAPPGVAPEETFPSLFPSHEVPENATLAERRAIYTEVGDAGFKATLSPADGSVQCRPQIITGVWNVVDMYNRCQGRPTERIGIRIVPGSFRIEADPSVKYPTVISVSIPYSRLVAAGVGHYDESNYDKSLYMWKPEVCVGNQCFTYNINSGGCRYLTLANVAGDQYLQVSNCLNLSGQ